MEQIDLFAWPDCGRTMYEAHTLLEPAVRTPDFAVRQMRYTHAAFGNSGAIGGALFPQKLNKKIVSLHEFIIGPSPAFQREITAGSGDVANMMDPQYLYNLYLHTETVAIRVSEFHNFTEQGPLSALHLFTVATIYEMRLIVYFADDGIETDRDREDWLQSIRGYFSNRSKFRIKAEKTLFTK